jgi:hypothetical protein
MIYTQTLRGSGSTELTIVIDSVGLTLRGRDLAGAFEEQFASLPELEAAYHRRARALFDDGQIRASSDVEDGPIEDLRLFFDELSACGFDRTVVAPLDPDDALEVSVAGFCETLRRELNRAFGPAPARVESVVLCADAACLHMAYVNCPVFANLDEADIDGVKDDGRWEVQTGPTHRRLRLGIAHEDRVQAPADWAGLPYEFLSAFLDLVDVRLEATPGFRVNIEPGVRGWGELRILHSIHEDVWFSIADRALAREYIDKPAGAYFERRREKLEIFAPR